MAQNDDANEQTVGSLLGKPLGATGDSVTGGPEQPAASAQGRSSGGGSRPLPSQIVLPPREEGWTIQNATQQDPYSGPQYNAEGVELLTYTNNFQQHIEQVWFDGKLVYAVDVGDVEIDPNLVKVAQEYQVVYAADLDERGKPRQEPEQVPNQLNIYDSVPGMEKYSPIWQFNYVVVPRTYEPNSLRSEDDCLKSGYPILRSQVFEN